MITIPSIRWARVLQPNPDGKSLYRVLLYNRGGYPPDYAFDINETTAEELLSGLAACLREVVRDDDS